MSQTRNSSSMRWMLKVGYYLGAAGSIALWFAAGLEGRDSTWSGSDIFAFGCITATLIAAAAFTLFYYFAFYWRSKYLFFYAIALAGVAWLVCWKLYNHRVSYPVRMAHAALNAVRDDYEYFRLTVTKTVDPSELRLWTLNYMEQNPTNSAVPKAVIPQFIKNAANYSSLVAEVDHQSGNKPSKMTIWCGSGGLLVTISTNTILKSDKAFEFIPWTQSMFFFKTR